MNYGYARVSTINQHLDRQIDELHKVGLMDSQIFIDKESGKDFNRTNYKKLLKKLWSEALFYFLHGSHNLIELRMDNNRVPVSAPAAKYILEIPQKDKIKIINLTKRIKAIFSNTINIVFDAIFLAFTRDFKSSLTMTTSLDSFAASEPTCPIDIPTSLAKRQGASLIPSPT